MYDFQDPSMVALSSEVKESWPAFLEPVFSENTIKDAVAEGLSEKGAAIKELNWMRRQLAALAYRLEEIT